MAETRTIVGAVLAFVGLAVILLGLVLVTKTPQSLEDVVTVAKGWIDGTICIATGTTVLLAGVAVVKSV